LHQRGVPSHGSIIAREYGLPAVVNVACATDVIQTGQIIEVDGDLGVVRVLKQSNSIRIGDILFRVNFCVG